MAINTSFNSYRGPMIPDADAVNDERAPGYAFTPKQATQYAATGCFGRI